MTETEAGRTGGSHAAGSRAGRPAHAADGAVDQPRVNGAATAVADLPASPHRLPSLDSTTIIPRIPADGEPPAVPDSAPVGATAGPAAHPGAGSVPSPRPGRGVKEAPSEADRPARLRGTTAIADDVVEKVAGFAAEQVDGVFDLGGDVVRALSTIREPIGLGEGTSRRGVHVEQSGRQVRITLTLVVQFGHPAMQVAEQVRENVIAAVETMLAMDVTECNVIIDDIHVQD
jgi:uncharacterized alkaline shock family protein YloU